MSQSGQQQNPYMPTSGAQYSYGQPQPGAFGVSTGMQPQPNYAPQSLGASGGSKGQGGTGLSPLGGDPGNYNGQPVGSGPVSFNPWAASNPTNTQATTAAMQAAQMAMQNGMGTFNTKPLSYMSGNPAPAPVPTSGPNVNTGMNANPSWLNFFGGPQAQQNYANQYNQQNDPSIWGPNGPTWSA